MIDLLKLLNELYAMNMDAISLHYNYYNPKDNSLSISIDMYKRHPNICYTTNMRKSIWVDYRKNICETHATGYAHNHLVCQSPNSTFETNEELKEHILKEIDTWFK